MSILRGVRRRRAHTLKIPMLLVTVALVWMTVLPAVFGQAPTQVTFWHALGADHQSTLNELIDEFNAAHPDVVVQAEYQGNYGALQQKLIAAVAAKRPPTMSLVYNNWTAAFVEGEAITPVSTWVYDPDVGLSDEERADFLPAFIAANTWDDTWTTVPFNKSIYVLYYNSDLLAQAGVGVPSTMDELRDAARAVTEATDATGLVLQADVDQFAVFLRPFGGDWIDAQGKSAFHSPAGQEALGFMQQLVQEGSAYYHDGYLDDEFNQGQAAMFFATVATIPWLSSDDHAWGAAPVPAAARQAAVVQGTDLAVFSQASAEQQLAAWRFIRWLTSPDINARWAAATGYLPVRSSATESDVYHRHVESAPEKYFAGVSQLPHAQFDPGLSAWFDARAFIDMAVEKALIQGTSPEVALNEAAAKTDQALAN